MSFKTIAVHLDDGPRCATRVVLAASLATRFEGKLIGIAPTGVPDVILGMNSALPDGLEVIALSLAHLRERAEATAQAFDAQCKALGIRAESRLVVEEALDAMVEHGRCSDLIVVGQTDRHQAPDGLAFDFPQQALLHAGPPVLVVPYAGVFASVGQNVLVAWKGTREAANAVRNALPLAALGETRDAGRGRRCAGPRRRRRLADVGQGLARIARHRGPTRSGSSPSPASAPSCCRAPPPSAPT